MQRGERVGEAVTVVELRRVPGTSSETEICIAGDRQMLLVKWDDAHLAGTNEALHVFEQWGSIETIGDDVRFEQRRCCDRNVFGVQEGGGVDDHRGSPNSS